MSVNFPYNSLPRMGLTYQPRAIPDKYPGYWNEKDGHENFNSQNRDR
ncbi:MAG: hypothetical protein HUU50_07625 [Candidatus Brocadiae bacterium]|nr:hypothetical protein [Candidatus Brocadiia bacterium]